MHTLLYQNHFLMLASKSVGSLWILNPWKTLKTDAEGSTSFSTLTELLKRLNEVRLFPTYSVFPCCWNRELGLDFSNEMRFPIPNHQIPTWVFLIIHTFFFSTSKSDPRISEAGQFCGNTTHPSGSNFIDAMESISNHVNEKQSTFRKTSTCKKGFASRWGMWLPWWGREVELKVFMYCLSAGGPSAKKGAESVWKRLGKTTGDVCLGNKAGLCWQGVIKWYA